MIIRKIHTSIFMFLVISNVTGCQRSVELPSRADCIVKVTPKAGAATSIVEPDPGKLAQSARALGTKVAGSSRGKDGGFYIQFATRCENREANARKIMGATLGDYAENLEYQSQGIVPGPDTINAFGDAWKDTKGREPFDGN